jgi:3D (Asp-Asp-Asp) domain-containing protein
MRSPRRLGAELNKAFLLACIFALCGGPAASARPRRSPSIRCVATAYSVSGETADGDLTKYRHTIAADPHVIPLGSKVRIEGAGVYSGVYTVTDTGRKVQGNSVDIFIPSVAAAKQFGKKPVRVRILKVGDEKVGEKEAKSPPGTASRP